MRAEAAWGGFRGDVRPHCPCQSRPLRPVTSSRGRLGRHGRSRPLGRHGGFKTPSGRSPPRQQFVDPLVKPWAHGRSRQGDVRPHCSKIFDLLVKAVKRAPSRRPLTNNYLVNCLQASGGGARQRAWTGHGGHGVRLQGSANNNNSLAFSQAHAGFRSPRAKG